MGEHTKGLEQEYISIKHSGLPINWDRYIANPGRIWAARDFEPSYMDFTEFWAVGGGAFHSPPPLTAQNS
ncbi:unnamed protein product, partial [Adineta ricciae]